MRTSCVQRVLSYVALTCFVGGVMLQQYWYWYCLLLPAVPGVHHMVSPRTAVCCSLSMPIGSVSGAILRIICERGNVAPVTLWCTYERVLSWRSSCPFEALQKQYYYWCCRTRIACCRSTRYHDHHMVLFVTICVRCPKWWAEI